MSKDSFAFVYTRKGLIVILILLLLVGAAFVFFTMLSVPQKTTPNPIATRAGESIPKINPLIPTNIATNAQNNIIATVGDERIYQRDLKIEKANYPEKGQAADDILMQKLVDDSITLQAGRTANIIRLDPTIFNQPDKDYAARLSSVALVKKLINEKSQRIEGTIVSIWFANDKVGPLGYEDGRKVAMQKISSLHQAIRENTMTIQQVAQAIRNDTTLAQLDPQYQSNASFDFHVQPSQAITWEPAFDSILQELPEGNTSEIFTGKSRDEAGNMQDAYFMFGQVSKRVTTGPEPYGEWLKNERTKYTVSYE